MRGLRKEGGPDRFDWSPTEQRLLLTDVLGSGALSQNHFAVKFHLNSVRIQAFICNWPGKKQHAAELEAMFRQHCEVMVINTDDSLRARHPHWHHIGNEGYFTDQWNAALEQFDADVFLQIQADIWPTQLGRMLSECVRYISNFGVGVYAPNLNYTAHVFRRESLVRVNDAVYEVPNTDSSFWAMTSEVIRNTPAINPEINRLGWVPTFWFALWQDGKVERLSAIIDSQLVT
jgi:hypothetical protein